MVFIWHSNVPVLFSASLSVMSSSTVGSDRPFWFTLYAIKCKVDAPSLYDDEYNSTGDKSANVIKWNEKKKTKIEEWNENNVNEMWTINNVKWCWRQHFKFYSIDTPSHRFTMVFSLFLFSFFFFLFCF